jgi:hypothetical protein
MRIRVNSVANIYAHVKFIFQNFGPLKETKVYRIALLLMMTVKSAPSAD